MVRGDRVTLCIEQAVQVKDTSVGRTSWEGWQAEIRTPHRINPERAPAEIHLGQLKYFECQLSGGALGVI